MRWKYATRTAASCIRASPISRVSCTMPRPSSPSKIAISIRVMARPFASAAMDHQVVRERQPLRDVQACLVHEPSVAVGGREMHAAGGPGGGKLDADGDERIAAERVRDGGA